MANGKCDPNNNNNNNNLHFHLINCIKSFNFATFLHFSS